MSVVLTPEAAPQTAQPSGDQLGSIPHCEYRERVATRRDAADRWARRDRVLSHARLAVFAVGVAAGFLAMSPGSSVRTTGAAAVARSVRSPFRDARPDVVVCQATIDAASAAQIPSETLVVAVMTMALPAIVDTVAVPAAPMACEAW